MTAPPEPDITWHEVEAGITDLQLLGLSSHSRHALWFHWKNGNRLNAEYAEIRDEYLWLWHDGTWDAVSLKTLNKPLETAISDDHILTLLPMTNSMTLDDVSTMATLYYRPTVYRLKVRG